jgi:hypothetical protein
MQGPIYAFVIMARTGSLAGLERAQLLPVINCSVDFTKVIDWYPTGFERVTFAWESKEIKFNPW